MNILPCMRAWYAANPPVQKPAPFIRQLATAIVAAGGKVSTPVTELDARAIAAISPNCVTYCPGIPTKRFARQIQGATQLTARQRAYVWSTVYTFRRQIKDAALVAEAKRLGGAA